MKPEFSLSDLEATVTTGPRPWVVQIYDWLKGDEILKALDTFYDLEHKVVFMFRGDKVFLEENPMDHVSPAVARRMNFLRSFLSFVHNEQQRSVDYAEGEAYQRARRKMSEFVQTRTAALRNLDKALIETRIIP